MVENEIYYRLDD